MREFKFRAWDWDGENGYAMSYSRDWTCTFNQGFINKYSDGCVMQYTGLKDKNGVEIYEGDVIKFDNKIYSIKFYKGSFCLFNNNKKFDSIMCFSVEDEMYGDDYIDSYLHQYSAEYNYEVIGSIYQNKDLLNA